MMGTGHEVGDGHVTIHVVELAVRHAFVRERVHTRHRTPMTSSRTLSLENPPAGGEGGTVVVHATWSGKGIAATSTLENVDAAFSDLGMWESAEEEDSLHHLL